MYRSTMPDGKKVISDRPLPGASKVEELTPPPGNYAPGAPVPKGATPAAAPEKPASRSAQSAAAEADLKAAQRAYDEAVSRAAAGSVETEGDRQGTAKGGARRTEAYDKRQAELKAEVDAARERLDAAQRRYMDTR
jgi:hypothetical protein